MGRRTITQARLFAVIPTHFKSKLANTMSYPIGAEALTHGLGGAPHVADLRIWFLEEPCWPASRFREILANKTPYRVLSVGYSPARKPGYTGSNWQFEKGYFDVKWKVRVYPVQRELRHAAKELLLTQGLPVIVKWLSGSSRGGWLERGQFIELVFNPKETTLAAREQTGVI